MKLKIVTHNGGFHPDELFAIALIKRYVSTEVDILRTRDVGILDECLRDDSVWVIDVGGKYDESQKNFDHHQHDFSAKWKSTDISFSSCGLVWTYLKKNGLLTDMSRWALGEMESRLIKKIDLNDNGVSRWSQAVMFKLFNRDTQDDVQFFRALAVAEAHLENSIYFVTQEESNRSRLGDHAYDCNGDVVVVEDGGFNLIPMMSSMTDAKVLVESKIGEEGWAAQTLRSDVCTPVAWRGLSGEQLEYVSGIAGLVFAHRGGHLVKARTRDSALEAARVMLGC